MDIAELEETITVIRRLHNGKEYAKTGTVDEINVFQVQDEFGMGLLIELFKLFLDGICDQGIETVHVLKTHYNDVLYGFCF